MSHGGGCLCGAVRITADADPVTVRQCWCRLCQYLSAGGSTVNVIFPSEAVSISGDVKWRSDIADSGNSLDRGFCGECGTPLFSKSDARPHLMVIRVGAMDEPELFAPQVLIWTSKAPEWACLDPRLLQVERQPPPAR